MAAHGEGGATNGAAAKVDRVEALREEMSKHNVQAYIVPTEDPHMVRPTEHPGASFFIDGSPLAIVAECTTVLTLICGGTCRVNTQHRMPSAGTSSAALQALLAQLLSPLMQQHCGQMADTSCRYVKSHKKSCDS